MKKIAVITGANRGLGWGAAQALAEKEFDLVLLGRDRTKLEARAKELKGERVQVVELDLSKPASIEKAVGELKKLYPEGVDVVLNNAGVFLEKDSGYNPNLVRETLQTNTLGPLEFAVGVGELLKKKKGVLVNVSSGMGQLSEMEGGSPGYRISKTALNAVTRILAAEWKSAGVRVNSICPGWVKTDMGGSEAERTVEESVKGFVWAATIPSDGPTGKFFRDGKEISW
jgi:NAD(P)-dependent dehydrogenase (short-subunit alcohol dehydrogenase family)